MIIKEDYVSFEVAKLLKEKGFDIPLFTFYVSKEIDKGYFKIMTFTDDKIDNNHSKYCYLAPTLQMAMKWLREVHNLVINPVTTSIGTRTYGEWEADIYYRDSGIDATIDACGHIYGETYEEACDAGIRYCLEHLI